MNKIAPWKEIWLFMPEGEMAQRSWLMTQLAGLAQNYKWVEVRHTSAAQPPSVLPLGVDLVLWSSPWGGIKPKNPGIEDQASTLFIWVGASPNTSQLRWLSRWKKVWKTALFSQEADVPTGFHFWLKTSHTPASSPAWHQLVGVLAQVPATEILVPIVGPTEMPNSESAP
jgi:hypothetical protein